MIAALPISVFIGLAPFGDQEIGQGPAGYLDDFDLAGAELAPSVAGAGGGAAAVSGIACAQKGQVRSLHRT